MNKPIQTAGSFQILCAITFMNSADSSVGMERDLVYYQDAMAALQVALLLAERAQQLAAQQPAAQQPAAPVLGLEEQVVVEEEGSVELAELAELDGLELDAQVLRSSVAQHVGFLQSPSAAQIASELIRTEQGHAQRLFVRLLVPLLVRDELVG